MSGLDCVCEFFQVPHKKQPGYEHHPHFDYLTEVTF